MSYTQKYPVQRVTHLEVVFCNVVVKVLDANLR